MIRVNNSQELIVTRDGEYVIEAEGEVDLSLIFETSCSLFFSIKELSKLNIEAKINKDFDIYF